VARQCKRTSSITATTLTVLREHIKSESVDLIYLDPPFNSRQDYNVLFAEKSLP
jgi:16S rRNA G966 N2-methylase RsmD